MGRIIVGDDLCRSPQDRAMRLYDPRQVSGLKLWLSGNAMSYLSDGSSFETWPDISGAGHDATQSTSGYRPTVVKDKWNGHCVVRFNSALTQYMTIAQTSDHEPATGITLIAAWINLIGNNAARLLSLPWASSGWTSPYFSYGISTSLDTSSPYNCPESAIAVTSATRKIVVSTYACVDVPTIVAARYDKSNHKLWVNNVERNSEAATTDLDYTGSYTGGLCVGMRGATSPGEYINAYLGDVFVYNRNLTDAELAIVAWGFLKEKYGVAMAN